MSETSGPFCVFPSLPKSSLIAGPPVKAVHLLIRLSIHLLFLRERQQETDREGKESDLKQSKEDDKKKRLMKNRFS